MSNNKIVDKYFNKRPWLDGEGNHLPDSEIKKLCQEWSAETWDLYLSETVDRSCVELLSTNKEAFDLRSHEIQISTLFSDSVFDEYEHFRPFIEVALSGLTGKQYRILKGIYWDKKSESELATELSVTKGTINKQKTRSLKKMKKLIFEEAKKRHQNAPSLVA